MAGILLAAGRSTRFGLEDKLLAPLHGRPLLQHAAQAMRDAPLDRRFLIRSGDAHGLDGFTLVRVAEGAEMSRSFAAGIAAASEAGAEAALVTLADMPFVTAAHLTALIDACEGPHSLLVSADETGHRLPPALFGSSWFGALAEASGDAGGRHLLARATPILAPTGTLRDIDTLADLREASAYVADDQ
jgi:molybdenum cofactor cytidylyltransferase